MKKVMVVSLVAFLVGCAETSAPDINVNNLPTSCIGGVKYFFFTRGLGYGVTGYLSPKFGRDGKVELCEY